MSNRLTIIIYITILSNACSMETIIPWSLSDFTKKISWGDLAEKAAKSMWVNSIKKQLGNYPHKHEAAHVRISSELPTREIDAVEERQKHKVRPALEALLGKPLPTDKSLTLGVCCSGGGYRAMIATLGFLMGLEKIGVLDATTYMAGLSGSTWLLGPWLYRNCQIDNAKPVSLANYAKLLSAKTAKPLLKNSMKKRPVIDSLNAKIAFEQPLSSVDLWGALIINALAGDLGSSGQKLRITDLAATIETGSLLFPIFTSTIVHAGKAEEWMEFTPFEVGSSFLGGYIPTWSFGRKFNAGTSVDFAPEQTMGYGLGIFGSAYTASYYEAKGDLQAFLGNVAMDMAKELMPASTKEWIAKHKADEQRFSPARIYNFTHNMPGLQKSDEPLLTCVDAGMAFNLPFPPLLRPERQLDIILVMDASASVKDAPALAKAAEYARIHGLKFPPINLHNIDKKIVSVFKDETDSTIPVVIYFPRIANPAYENGFDPDPDKTAFCGTTNFAYKPEQFELLRGLMDTAVVGNKEIIVDEIKQRIALK
ncbi:hypothetical protein FJ365_03890 [Candidatus Dependentiae bacterium]|nr:hypothetical protein [Candidatus Dependentiae bacterium]